MNRSELLEYIKHPERLNEKSLEDLRRLVQEYPYFQTAVLLYLRNLKNTGDLAYTSELKRTALLVADRTRLEEVMEGKFEELKSEKLKKKSEKLMKEEREELEEFDELKESAPKLQHQDLIDRFITENPRIKPVGSDTLTDTTVIVAEDENVTDSIFTESLAKIYIKQKQYSKAIRIFEKLNLKYPEKSSYFADQIEKLQKLTENI
ncbi:MAG: hypothetical protein MJ009_03410 [Paludibacteraceae bacterium]|nr:hypothetical protein [Paludibacteraceae bacterium]